MFNLYEKPSAQKHFILESLTRLAFLGLLVVCSVVTSLAQGSFNSGSTGADGAFAPTQDVVVQVPPSGVLNYTTVNIPNGVHVRFTPNATNTPVTILATGNVTISGLLLVDGSPSNRVLGGSGGPGGFRGGNGGAFFDDPNGRSGDGPGGGAGGIADANLSTARCGGGAGFLQPGSQGCGTGGAGGGRYGSRTLLPLVGGSGGGGTSAWSTNFGDGGGGGGGAILIASSANIIFPGTWLNQHILARGGGGWNGGGGSGGAIRIVANKISGLMRFRVNGGTSSGGGHGAPGYIRVEGTDLNEFTPDLETPFISYALPNPVTLPNSPILNIVSVGGVNSPATPKGSFYQQPDIVVPTTMPNPVTVNLQATNLPVGTVLQVTLTNELGERTTVNSTPLAGTQASSTATASVTLPTSGIAVISASATLNLLIAYDKPIYIDGERIDKMEIAAAFGGPSDVTYISATGKRLKLPQ